MTKALSVEKEFQDSAELPRMLQERVRSPTKRIRHESCKDLEDWDAVLGETKGEEDKEAEKMQHEI